MKRFLEWEALSWANENFADKMSYIEFEGTFKRLWSDTKQARIKSEFQSVPNCKEIQGTIKQFCKDQLRKLVHLNKSFNKITQMEALNCRLPTDVQWDLVYGPDDNIEQFLNYVDKLDRTMDKVGKLTNHSNHYQRSGGQNWGNGYFNLRDNTNSNTFQPREHHDRSQQNCHSRENNSNLHPRGYHGNKWNRRNDREFEYRNGQGNIEHGGQNSMGSCGSKN